MNAGDNANHKHTQQTPPPNRWGTLTMLGCAVAIAAIVSAMLMQRHLDAQTVAADAVVQPLPAHAPQFATPDEAVAQAVLATSFAHTATLATAAYRPEPAATRTDLTSQTTRLTEQLEDALRAAGSLTVKPLRTELREDDAALWLFAKLEARVTFPTVADLMPERLTSVLDNAHVRVIDSGPDGASDKRLSVRYQGIECAEIHVLSGAQPGAEMKLAQLAVQYNGLDPDDVVRELYPDPEMLPLDSSELNNENGLEPQIRPKYTGPLVLAIIVDDGGYGGWITEEILSMPNTLTLSILPHAPFSYETAERAKELGFEVMLHMPMENVSGKTTYPGEVTVDMTPEQMLDLTNQALADVPGAIGINNHTGSKFTSNSEAMRTWLELIKDRELFFIDSRTTRYACAYEVADEMAIPTAARDLFLDHESGTAYIRARFRQIIDIVKRQGKAIAICHFRRNTVPVLKEMLPVFEREGITIVHASTLVQ